MKRDDNVKPNQEIEFFSTTDLPLAATLLCHGFDCSIDSTDQSRAKFLFKNTVKLMAIVNMFWANDLKVSPKDFSNAQRDLKARIREGV